MKPLEAAWMGVASNLPESWAEFAREAKILFYAGAHAARCLAEDAERILTEDEYAAFDARIDGDIHDYLSREFLGTYSPSELGKPQ